MLSTKGTNLHRRSHRTSKRVFYEPESERTTMIAQRENQGLKRCRVTAEKNVGACTSLDNEHDRIVQENGEAGLVGEYVGLQNGTSLTLSQRRTMAKEKRNVGLTVENEHSGATAPSPSTESSLEDCEGRKLISTDEFNDCKIKLSEITKEKRNLTAAIDALTDKCDRQERDIRRQSQEITALQAMVKQSNRKGRKSSKKGCWNQDDENSPIAEYKGIRFQLDLIVNEHARLVVTESAFTPNGLIQIRDWTCSSTVFTRSACSKAVVFVYLPNGSVAIPTCAMLRASHNKFYIDRYDSTSSFVREVTSSLLDGSAGRGMTDDDKENCINTFCNYPGILSKFRTALLEETNNCKQGAKSTFLKALGYRKSHLGEMKNDENENKTREEEKKVVFERCCKEFHDGQPDTMHWRLSTYVEIRNIHLDVHSEQQNRKMVSCEQAANNENAIDTLFLNEPARMAFNHIRGYAISHDAVETEQDVSILTLARADAWMTLSLMNIGVSTKGGNRGNKSVRKYEELVLISLDRIINDVWEDIKSLTPFELAVSMGRGGGSMDPYCNNVRKWTVVLESPNDGYLYLVVTPEYFSSNICSWFGRVKDLQIGRCKQKDEQFERITKTMHCNQFEDSDIDNELNVPPRTPISPCRTNSEPVASSVHSSA